MSQPPLSALSAAPRILLPHAPALAVSGREALWLDTDGEFIRQPLAQAVRQVVNMSPLLCHAPSVAARLGVESFPCLDILELYAFVYPASFCLPTPRGVADALGLVRPRDLEDEAESLLRSARRLLEDAARLIPQDVPARAQDAKAIAWSMARSGWGWSTAVLAALGVETHDGPASGPRVWEKLPEWSDHAPEPAGGTIPVDAQEARARLGRILGEGAEQRPSQADYASAAAAAFQPRDRVGEPRLVLAEAGTGTGKTLGYMAPASLWAEKNAAPVWIATYTRNLQRQLDGEMDRLFRDPREKARKVVVRKGRENYVCLLSVEEQVSRSRPGDGIANGLIARWLQFTRDGDMVGGDFPGWLPDLLGRTRTMGLTDRRGECIFSACPHYSRCFIEKTVRRARRAELVVANHALVLIQAAMGGLDDATMPTRYVFDEGHHLFDAADSAFSAHLSGFETQEMRRWLLGPEEGERRSRARGLRRRAEDIIGLVDQGPELLDNALSAARCLSGPGWQNRILDTVPANACEEFLCLVRQQVYGRSKDTGTPYDLETECHPLIDQLDLAAASLSDALGRLGVPLQQLTRRLEEALDKETAELETALRNRIESLCRSIDRRVLLPLAGWKNMLDSLSATPPEAFVDWFSVQRQNGQDVDVGMHRHWIDPSQPFAKAVVEPAHGVLITSATLRDGSGREEQDWQRAEERCGIIHLSTPAIRAQVASPFDYPQQTRILVVSDVRKDDLDQVAAAYRELFLASEGGGLGLFTAISRLKAVHRRIVAPLEEAGFPLLAQHVDALDTGTMVDIFRAEEHSCLLGTDAVRDGVDVPGQSLRLIVFDRVPWPRPDILHKARRMAFGGKAYDDMLARLRLKQAFGRLVRRADDRGIFVLLDPMMPSRLHGAFPPGVPVRKVGIAQAVAECREFFRNYKV